MDRAEATGLGVALAGHAALLAVLSVGFATATREPPVSDPIEVSFVDEVGMTSAMPQPSSEAPAPSIAPEIGPPEEAAPDPEPVPAPPQPLPPPPRVVEPTPQPKLEPKPVPKVAPKPAPPKAAPAKPAPPKAAPPRPAPAKAAPARPQPKSAAPAGTAAATRGSRLGRDFLKGLGSEPSTSTAQKPAGAVMSAVAMAGIQAAIRRQIQPCADQQVDPGPGANRITVKVNLRLKPDGSLAARPAIVSTSGVDDENSRYEKRVGDLAIAAFTGCSPLRGLPDELYQTPKGGWSNFNMNYKLPG